MSLKVYIERCIGLRGPVDKTEPWASLCIPDIEALVSEAGTLVVLSLPVFLAVQTCFS